jgi:23S rRNA (uracil1939-C5)-methyltransferase
MYKKKQIVEVKILDLAEKNQCFGRLEDGMSIFVQGPAAVGDRVEAEIFKIKKKYLVARMHRLLEPSVHRIDPVCSYFGLCGGCKWQHMEYAEQLRLKRKQVQDALEHLGGFQEIVCDPCCPAPDLLGYRNKMDFSFTDLRYLTKEEMDQPIDEPQKPLDFALGFHAPGC